MTGEHDSFTSMVLLGYVFTIEDTEDRRLLEVTVTPPAGIKLSPVYGPAAAGRPAMAKTQKKPRGENTITTVIPHYVGTEETQREVLLAIRRILLKYGPLPKLPVERAEAGDG